MRKEELQSCSCVHPVIGVKCMYRNIGWYRHVFHYIKDENRKVVRKWRGTKIIKLHEPEGIKASFRVTNPALY